MVLFKRKPVQFLPQPGIRDDNEEVWFIPITNEVFMDYDSYLQRMDFYKQRKFSCEITGHSLMNFFDALKSEDFKQDFYPGEAVTIFVNDGNRLSGVVRDKTKFPAIVRQDGTLERRAFSRYFVKLIDRPQEEALVDDEHIVRDRKAFTKQMLRSFIKNTVTREAWTGAPWLVKPNVAQEYRISTEIPPHLQYGSRAAEKKANATTKKGEHDGLHTFWAASRGLPELKPAPKGQKHKMSAEEMAIRQHEQFMEYQRSLQGNPEFLNGAGPMMVPHLDQQHHVHYMPHPVSADLGYYTQIGPQHPHTIPYAPVAPPMVQVVAEQRLPPPPPPPPPPPKYPIEDMDIAPERDSERPLLQFMSSRKSKKATKNDYSIKMESIGLLLETWTTLNVYCEVFQLDSFTFDDFVEAMSMQSPDECELLVEIHCSVLKRLVNGENDQNGSIQISLPDFPQEDDDEEDGSDESSEAKSPTPEPEETFRRTTRSSLAKQASPPRSRSESADVKVHRADEMFTEYTWLQRLRKRDFKDGGWQMILVGLLHQLSMKPQLQTDCDRILEFLAPLDAEPTQETVQDQYADMNINLRVKALQIITILTLETKTMKLYLEQSAAQMTEYRKEKIDYQRARKIHIEELRKLHDDRKILAPEQKSPTPPPELKRDINGDANMPPEIDDSEAPDSEDGEPLPSRSLRRATDRALERKRKREEEQERKERAEAAKQSKGMKAYQKVLKRIEDEQKKIRDQEDQIAEMDLKLRQTDRPRMRALGRDRFWNRYFWFERNAMPFEGSADSSTADAGYANGRLWIQGPDIMEREGYIDVPQLQQENYRKNFGLTPLQRKEREEGSTCVYNAYEWGFYDDPEALDQLIGWLDPRGMRELKLRKELQAQREFIINYMERRKAHLSEREAEVETAPPKRMATRRKEHVDEEQPSCLRWKNETALREIGCKHSDGLPPPKGRNRGKKGATTIKAKDEGARTRLTNRQGKPLTRQGGRYPW
ncbi:MAG: hypothetical protein Q9160_007759 [Pyrenula sp. 1 TL-2023]